MAYLSSTTTSPNVPQLVEQGISVAQSSGSTVQTFGGAPRTWIYVSTHISSDIEEANFFTDGQELGFRLGDNLVHVGSTTWLMTSHSVVAVGSTTSDLGVGTTIGLGA
jgi:hypothetical protein